MDTAVLQILFSISRMAFGRWFPVFLPAGSTECRESTVEGSLGKKKSIRFSFFALSIFETSPMIPFLLTLEVFGPRSCSKQVKLDQVGKGLI